MTEHCVYVASLGDDVLYVGYSKQIERRKVQHRCTSHWYSDDIEWSEVPCQDRIDARRKEARLIRSLRPLHNKDIPRLDPENAQPWQRFLSDQELRKMGRSRELRDDSADEYNALRLKLKSKADALIRADKARRKPTD